MKKTDRVYHSAYNEEVEAEECSGFSRSRIIAMQNDIRNGLPAEFSGCDVLYAEPSGLAGFFKFNKRAGVKGGTYKQLVLDIGQAIYKTKTPAYLVIMDPMREYLPPADAIVPVELHGMDSGNTVTLSLFVWRGEVPPVRSSIEVIDWLAEKYQCVGDFMCGYGNTGKVFLEAGKSCVLSDYNAKCIGYIKNHYKEWQRRK